MKSSLLRLHVVGVSGTPLFPGPVHENTIYIDFIT